MDKFDLGMDITTILNAPMKLVKPLKPASSNLSSFASLWAKHYIHNISQDISYFAEATPRVEIDRSTTALLLTSALRWAQSQAWMQTEIMLHDVFLCHSIDLNWVDPLMLATETQPIFTKLTQAYGESISTQKSTLQISQNCDELRTRYIEKDARLLGFISLYCDYAGRALLSHLDNVEKLLFNAYLNAFRDYLSMPLREMYCAAAKCDLMSPELRAVQQLLPISSQTARRVYKRVRDQNPGYVSYSGRLNSEHVRTASIRDIELFLIYLCLCLLEGNMRSIQEQLFPICVMVYPALSVKWELVQGMLKEIGWEMHKSLLPSDMLLFLPYLRALEHMFSSEIFDESSASLTFERSSCFRSNECFGPNCI
jgi:hypothetical protein